MHHIHQYLHINIYLFDEHVDFIFVVDEGKIDPQRNPISQSAQCRSNDSIGVLFFLACEVGTNGSASIRLRCEISLPFLEVSYAINGVFARWFPVSNACLRALPHHPWQRGPKLLGAVYIGKSRIS